MTELHSATLIADVDVIDTVELPVRKAGSAGLFKMTLLKIKDYVLSGGGLPPGGDEGQILTKLSATDGDADWVDGSDNVAPTETGPSGFVAVEPTHPKWRLLISQIGYSGGGGDSVQFAEIEFRTLAGETQDEGPGTATVSSYFDANVPGNALNGNTADFWHSNGGYTSGVGTGWFAYEFTTPRAVTQIMITLRNHPNGLSGAPKTFDVQYNDGSGWITSWSVADAGWTTQGETKLFTNPDAASLAHYYPVMLAALNDVDLTGIADGDILVWDATEGKFLPATDGGGGGGLPAGGTEGQVLTKLSSTDGDADWADGGGGGGGGGPGTDIIWAGGGAGLAQPENAVVTVTGGSGTPQYSMSLDGWQDWFWPGGVTAGVVVFDFGTPVVIAGVGFRQDGLQTQGNFQISGSNDGSTYTNLGSPDTWGGRLESFIAFTNSTPYRYYKATQVSGSTSSAPYQKQFFFGWKLASASGGGATGVVAKAMIKFAGDGTKTLVGAENIASVTRASTGEYNVVFTTAIPADCIAIISGRFDDAATPETVSVGVARPGARKITTAGFGFTVWSDHLTSGPYDPYVSGGTGGWIYFEIRNPAIALVA